MSEEIVKLADSLSKLGEKIEKDMATKGELNQHAELVGQLSKAMDRQKLASEKVNPNRPGIFTSKAQAVEFVDIMKNAIASSNQNLGSLKGSEFLKSDLNQTTNTGGEFIPTAVSSTFSALLAQGSVGRRYATVYEGVQGSIDITKRNGTSTAVFTSADDSTVTATAFGTAKVTLSPKQISALSNVSDKLLYASAVNVAEAVAMDLIEQAGVLEDTALISGDGTSTYGSVTGLNTASSLGQQAVTFSSFALDDVLNLPALVHESVYGSPNARYYMSGAVMTALRQKKASSSGVYHLDPTTGSFTLGGYPIVVWHRMDNTIAAGKKVVFFGDLAKCSTIGIGRDMSLVADRSFKFGSNQTSFRLTYDWHAVHVQPSAMARVALTT